MKASRIVACVALLILAGAGIAYALFALYVYAFSGFSLSTVSTEAGEVPGLGGWRLVVAVFLRVLPGLAIAVGAIAGFVYVRGGRSRKPRN